MAESFSFRLLKVFDIDPQARLAGLMNHVFSPAAAWIQDGDERLRALRHLLIAPWSCGTSVFLPIGWMPFTWNPMLSRILFAKRVNTLGAAAYDGRYLPSSLFNRLAYKMIVASMP